MSRADTCFARAFSASRGAFVLAGAFSLVVNLLLLTTSVYLMQIFDRVLASGSLSTLIHLTVIATGALLVLAVLEALRVRALSRVSAWLEMSIAPAALVRTIELSLNRSGTANSALNDLGTLRSFLGGYSVLSLFDAPWVPVYLGVIYLLHPMLGHVALAGAVLLFGLAIINNFATRRSLARANISATQAGAVSTAAIRNAEIIDALGLANNLVRRWAALSSQAWELQARAASRAAIVQGLSKFARLFVQVAVLAAGAWLVITQDLTGGAMIAASIILSRALAPVEQAIGTWKQAVQAVDAFKRLKAFFAAPPRRSHALRLPEPRGFLSVERVSFGFAPDKPRVLSHVSFSVKPGEALAVVGPSASGKSTLARLLVGIEHPSAGAVRLDGANVFAWRREELGRHIGYLPQDIELFSGSVAENIARLGPVDAELVVAAALMADCHEMILRLDRGYDTEIGEDGLRLSGGERQRVALARALYGCPKLVVLDEPNANLDSAGERALSGVIAGLKENGTAVVVIGHRPSTLAAVDKILVLVGGRVDAYGSREELLGRTARQNVHAVTDGVGR
jgi:PrtD family type I secretion system ABC transporter